MVINIKICSKCGKEYPSTAEYFYRNSKAKDGLRCECKNCQQAFYAKYYEDKHREEREAKQKIEQDLIKRGKQVCSKCGKEYDATLEYFYPIKERKSGLSTWCKSCSKIETAKYNKINHDIILKKNRERYNKIKDNPEFKERRKLSDKKREENNRFGRCFSKALYRVLKHSKNEQHWEDLVPYTYQELREYIESQFTPEMSWQNYGNYWELDHIIPQNLFNYSSYKDRDFQICWSLLNLRPLEKIANRSRPKDGSDISNEQKQQILNQIL